jgi:hypothetical protein
VLEIGDRKSCCSSFAYVTCKPILEGLGGGGGAAFIAPGGDLGAAIYQPPSVVYIKYRYVIALAAYDVACVPGTRSEISIENHILQT